jgi:hypothetical protein
MSVTGCNVGEDFLLEKPNLRQINGTSSFRKEQLQELGEKALQKFFEQTIMVNLIFRHLTVLPLNRCNEHTRSFWFS